jgi:hypothetical protein
MDRSSEVLDRLVGEGDLDGLLALVSVDEIADAWWRYRARSQEKGFKGDGHDEDFWAIELWLSGGAIYEREDALRAGLML